MKPGLGVKDDAKHQRGVRGGEIVATGTSEDVAAEPQSFTGAYLKALLSGDRALARA